MVTPIKKAGGLTMLNRIIRFSLHNRLAVLVAAVLLMTVGTYTVSRMEVDVFPDLNAPTVVVMTEARGMAPEEVERLVTFPIETAVNGSSHVRRVRSSSTTGFSIVWVEFDWDTPIHTARQTVSEKLTTIGDALPPGVGQPTLGPQSSILGELMFVSLTSGKSSPQDLRTLADWTIRPRLLATGGVAQVAVIGGEVKEYQILLDPARMRHYGVSLSEVYTAVDRMNQNTVGGIHYEFGNEYILRTMLGTQQVEEMGRTLIRMTDNDKPVTLDDIAQVCIGNQSPRTGVASHNGQSAVVLTVTKQPHISTMDLTENLDRTLAEVQSSLPDDVKVSTEVYRQSRFIESSIHNVRQALIEGAVFVVIVLMVFLMNLRTTVISLITIPLSLLTAILALKWMGLTINTMSLGGMCIAIGSLVDDAVVDVENVFRHIRENRLLPPDRRKPLLTIIYEASREVRMPILNSTLIIVASFLPLFFLSGMEGKMLEPLGIAFVVALGASTLVALTVTPVLCSFLLGHRRPQGALGNDTEQTANEPFVARKLKSVYLKALKVCLSHRRWVMGLTGGALIAAIVIMTTLGRSFLPPFNEGSLTVSISTLPGVSLEVSDSIGRQAERALLSIPEIKAVGRKTGRAELDEHALGVNNSELEAPFELADRSKDEMIAEVRERLNAIPGITVEVGAPITHRIDAMLSGTRAGIAIKVFGPDLNRLYTIGNEIKEAVHQVDGIADLTVEPQIERPQLRIVPKREMLARYGISLPDLGRDVSVLLGGEAVSQVFEGERNFDLTLKVSPQARRSMDDIRNLLIDAGNGGKVPLSNVADITSASGPHTINRENVSRKLVVSANVAGRDLHGVMNDIQASIRSQVKLPQDYHIEYGGQFESEQSASRTLLLASFLSLLVIFMLIYGQFRHLRQSVMILLNLPLALIGGIVAIRLSDGIISIPALIGFISLFGIATRNGILLVTRYNDLHREGLSPTDAVLRGSADRLNPILMTALTSALALIPMVWSGDLPGNEIQRPMACVILGGLFSSTLLNGFIIPIMYLAKGHRTAGKHPDGAQSLPSLSQN